MRIVMFCHSLLSDWNHGNAHFLRGICSELIRRNHNVEVWEPENSWSLSSLRKDYGDAPVARFESAYPLLKANLYDPASPRIEEKLEGADLVLVHEWNEPSLVAEIGRHHAAHPAYILLFHDTHHRSVTDPESMSRYDLRYYDGVLAFGRSIAEVYERNGWADRVWTWHEAADINVFRPLVAEKVGDVVWIGNWGDDERAAELQEFLFDPIRKLGLPAKIHGVRYPAHALEALARAGIEYGGWIPNFDAPHLFAQYRATIHVPRRPYAEALPGIPTIRIFEALACGIPLISAPWDDCEHLFTPGKDFLVARDGAEVECHLLDLLDDPAYAATIAAHGLATIRARHTCAHRAEELLRICEEFHCCDSGMTMEGATH